MAIEEPVAFSPRLRAEDDLANYWLRQVTLRLRREVCWLWHERGILAGVADSAGYAILPPYIDRLSEMLDLTRYEHYKRAFFASDTTAQYLTKQIDVPPPAMRGAPPTRGGFCWVARELNLQPVDCFALALALLPVVDSAAGSIIAACLNDPGQRAPNLTLGQRLWERPGELLGLFDPGHRLARHGLLFPAPATWEAALVVPGLVAQQLVRMGDRLPTLFDIVPPPTNIRDVNQGMTLSIARLKCVYTRGVRLVPVLGQEGAPLAAMAAAYSRAAGSRLVAATGACRGVDLQIAFTLAWLRGLNLYVPYELLADPQHHGETTLREGLPLDGVPLTVFVGITDRAHLRALPPAHMQAPLVVPSLTYTERLALWQERLPAAQTDAEIDAALADCARRFRCEAEHIKRICTELGALDRPPRPADLYSACRADLDLGTLAQVVEPRFRLDELMLPQAQAEQVDEIVRAMCNLTRAHYLWGTGRAWNEGGLSALFTGAPGTGKTMAAEAIATELGLPLYRIDLSQVVNKYIGETEKNLRRLFDAAEASDVILFFDEADSLFGKRTEVKDAHDRYANLEVSYLLERMERFKGLAILATNRRKDLDEAFMRRLRFLVEFPLPGAIERLRIWRSVIPEGVDASALDFEFLANRFPLAGGHLRAIIFHACLQAASPGKSRKLEMREVISAVRREYEKLDRAVSLDQFGPYAPLVTVGGGL